MAYFTDKFNGTDYFNNIDFELLGFTSFKVIFNSENCRFGDLVNVKITSFNKNNLFGYHVLNKVKVA